MFYVDVINQDLLSDLSTACLTLIQDVDERFKDVQYVLLDGCVEVMEQEVHAAKLEAVFSIISSSP